MRNGFIKIVGARVVAALVAAAVIMVAGVVMGCEKEGKKLVVEPTYIDFTVDMLPVTVTVESSASWMAAKSNSDWFDFDYADEGSMTVIVSSANPDPEPRTGRITIGNGDGLSAVITVMQEGSVVTFFDEQKK